MINLFENYSHCLLYTSTALANNRQPSTMKLVTLGEDEKIIGLHGIGYGVDEMIQGFSVAIKMLSLIHI